MQAWNETRKSLVLLRDQNAPLRDMAEIYGSKQIQANFCYLLKHVDPCNRLLDHLYKAELMSSREVECIQRIPTTAGKNEQLLLLILRHQASTSFWEALVASNQSFIVTEVKQATENTTDKENEFADITVDDEKLIKVKVLQHLGRILEVVSPVDVLPYVFEKGIISLSEYDEISDRRACCKQLIHVLYQKEPNVRAFFHLKVALFSCYQNIFVGNIDMLDDGNGEQGKIVTVVEPGIIRFHFTYLLKNVQVSNLLDHLIDKGVIDAHEKESLDNQPCSELKVERMLLLLMKRSANCIVKFLEALRDSDQGFIADEVLRSDVINTLPSPARGSQSDSPDKFNAAKEWVEENKKSILDTVDSFVVLPYLFEKGVISIAEYEEILCCQATCRPLVSLLYNQDPKNNFPFSHLWRAMSEKYSYLVDELNAAKHDTPYFDRPECLHIVNLEVGIWGVAVLRNVLYVAMHNSSTIFKYNADEPFNFLGKVDVTNLRWPADMVADESRGCLYISDRYGDGQLGLFVLFVDDSQTFISLDVTPGGLSLLAGGRLMVVYENKKVTRGLRIYRFSSDGNDGKLDPSFDEILMPNAERYLLQAAMIKEDTNDPEETRIAISQVHKSTLVHRIICVDGHGDEVCEFGERGSNYPRHLMFPYSVAIDPVPDGDVVMLANDCDNHRVIVIRLVNDNIEYQMDLISAKDGEEAQVMFCPRRICWDPSRGILFIGSGYKSTKSEIKREQAIEAAMLDKQPNASGNVTVWRVALPRSATT